MIRVYSLPDGTFSSDEEEEEEEDEEDEEEEGKIHLLAVGLFHIYLFCMVLYVSIHKHVHLEM